MIVRAVSEENTRYGIITRMSDSVITLRSLRPNGKSFTMDVPRSRYVVEQLAGWQGMSGLASVLIREDEDENYRTKEILALIEDQSTLAWIVTSEGQLRPEAAERLTDEDLILRILQENFDSWIWSCLLPKVKDEDRLVDFARFVNGETPVSAERISLLLKRVSQAGLIRGLRRTKGQDSFRRRIRDFLAADSIAQLAGDEDPELRELIVAKADHSIVIKLATSDPSADVRTAAVQYVGSKDVLLAVAKDDEDRLTAYHALERVLGMQGGSLTPDQAVRLAFHARSENVKERAGRFLPHVG